MKNIKQFIVPTFVLFAICLVASLLLGITNDITEPKIEANALAAKQEAMCIVMPDAKSFGKETKNDYGTGVEALNDANEIIGYCITSVGKGGYGGEISMMVGVNADGTVNSVSVLEDGETASIGGKLKTNGFLDRFAGLSGKAALTKDGGTVDAVSGATKTSTGMTDAVNNALLCYAEISGEVSTNG